MVEVGDEKFETTARILTGVEREQAFEKAWNLAKFLLLLSNDLLFDIL